MGRVRPFGGGGMGRLHSFISSSLRIPYCIYLYVYSLIFICIIATEWVSHHMAIETSSILIINYLFLICCFLISHLISSFFIRIVACLFLLDLFILQENSLRNPTFVASVKVWRMGFLFDFLRLFTSYLLKTPPPHYRSLSEQARFDFAP